MPASPWKSPLQRLPLDGATVWVRRMPFYDTPVLAIFSQSAQTFTAKPLDGAGTSYVNVPVSLPDIHSWKPSTTVLPSGITTESGDQFTTEDGDALIPD
jgi:hypothetical protein